MLSSLKCVSRHNLTYLNFNDLKPCFKRKFQKLHCVLSLLFTITYKYHNQSITNMSSGEEEESDIQRLIQKNREEKNLFISNLIGSSNFTETTEGINSLLHQAKKPKQNKSQKRKQTTSDTSKGKIRRVSARLQHKVPEFSHLDLPPENTITKNKNITSSTSTQFNYKISSNHTDEKKTQSQILTNASTNVAFVKTSHEFLENIFQSRQVEGESILSFKFNKNRCRVLTEQEEVKRDCEGILYWMSRDCRVQDNWALLFAQRLALKNEVPLHIVCFIGNSHDLYPSRRQFKFFIEGLKFVKQESESLNINFYVINEEPTNKLLEIIESNNIGCLVTDFLPLRKITKWKKFLTENLPSNVPLVEVDAHNIVPVWIASEKQVSQQRILRSKILRHLDNFLTEFPIVCKHKFCRDLTVNDNLIVTDFDKIVNDYTPELKEVTWAVPGSPAAFETLRKFCLERLKFYEECNDPNKDVLSNLSPWLHFGQISAQRVALEVSKFKSTYPSNCESFLDQLIMRRELSDNFCFYNHNYDNLKSIENWASQSLNVHRKDPRPYVYSLDEFENARTHDLIWNAAQIQMRDEGKMHRYMRMYWCKKILEWTETPEKAIETALYLNDLYSLDGTDPNGYVGVLWCIGGLFDFGFREREVFGKVRYMVDHCMVKKFDVGKYCEKFGLKFVGVKPKEKNKKTVA